MAAPNDIIVYHYTFSPFARRIIWYLQLRQIPYAECIQSHVLPRPALSQELGIQYRRIPLVAIGKDVYCDTRLILRKLEQLFPDGRLGAVDAEKRGLERLLEKWTVDAGIFYRAAQAIPTDLPVMKDPKFLKDRSDLTGRAWSAAGQERGRAEALAHLRDGFELLEATLLADGREWILKTDKPTLADIEAVWPFWWLTTMPGALPENVASPKAFPKVFAWIDRFKAAIKTASKALGKAVQLDGPNAAVHILQKAQSRDSSRGVDSNDPLQLAEGDEVQISPIDSGFRHKDTGRLVTLQSDEATIAIKTPKNTELLLHFPRWGYRIQKAADSSKI